MTEQTAQITSPDPAPPQPAEAPPPPPAAVDAPAQPGAMRGPDQPSASAEAPPEGLEGTTPPAPEGDTASSASAEGEIVSTPLATADRALDFLDKGGIVIWTIAGLSVVTLALILMKLWRLVRAGAWRRDRAEAAVAAWSRGDHAAASELTARRNGVRGQLVAAALAALAVRDTTEADAREETARVAKRLLAEAGSGLRALELIATVAPLLGLLGTVLGMIVAFQALQTAGGRADPAALAGGIWEALLTTAAGMAVAIPASAALSYFESVVDRLRLDLEDLATRIFTRQRGPAFAQAAE